MLATCFEGLDGSGLNTLTDWIQGESLTDARDRLRYAWLPDTYRGLEHLYYSAYALERSIASDVRVLEIGTQVRRLLANLAGEAPHLQVDLEIQSVSSADGRPKLAASASWPAYRAGVTASSSWKPILRNRKISIMLREVGSALATDAGGGDPDSGAGSERRDLSPKELSAALVTQSILGSHLFEPPAPGGPLFLVDSSSEFLQSIRVFGLPTDDKFIFLPGSSGVIHFARWLSSWNWMVRQSVLQSQSGSPFGRLLACNCAAVEHIWCDGQEPGTVGPPDDLRSAFHSVSRRYIHELAKVSADDDWRTVPPAAFCEWYEKLLPLAFHEALLSTDELQTVMETWQGAVSGSPRSAESIAGLRTVLMRALEVEEGKLKVPSRAKIWMFGYRVLVRNVAPDLSTYLNDFEKEYNERAGRGSKGREAVEQAVAFSEQSSVYVYAHKVTEEGRDEEALIRRTLAQLRP